MATKKAKERTEKQNERKKVQKYMYLGPPILNGRYKPGMVISRTDEQLENLIKKQPLFNSVIVKVESFPAVKQQKSAISSIYKKIEIWMEGDQ